MIDYFRQPRFAPFSLEHEPEPGRIRTGVLLVHGFTGTPYDMRPIAEVLFGLGADCHAIQVPGMAHDIENLPAMTAQRWRAELLTAWEVHRQRYDRTVIVGYSMGGAAAIQMAAQTAPDRLILLAPFWRINDRRAMALPLLKRVVKEISPLRGLDFTNPDQRAWFRVAMPGLDVDDPEVQRMLREDTSLPSGVINELRTFGKVAFEEARQVDAPVIVLQATRDRVVPVRFTRRLIQEFPNLVAYHEFPGDHLLPLDTVGTWPRVRDLIAIDAAPAIDGIAVTSPGAPPPRY